MAFLLYLPYSLIKLAFWAGCMKQIPNLFTLLNLIFGCIAIVFILQTGETIVVMDNMGATQVTLPEKIWWGALLIFAAAIIDFLDGFLARLLRAQSKMGEQLDSLSDVVSFGVAPGMILYQLLRISYAQEENGLDVPLLALVPAFIYSGAVAWRLAKFNISTTQKYSFEVFINKWLLYGIILILSFLMLSNMSFMAMKFTDFSLKSNGVKYALIGLSLIAIIVLKWLAVPVIFILYLVLSQFSKAPVHSPSYEVKESTDITV
jgi:CDP-diacylglycerol--serine O-phosphatidyltransferase